jgi:hypothetical protein
METGGRLRRAGTTDALAAVAADAGVRSGAAEHPMMIVWRGKVWANWFGYPARFRCGFTWRRYWIGIVEFKER